MININLESLLGREFDDEIIKSAIDHFNFPRKRPRISSREFYIGIESLTEGIDLNLTSVESIDFIDQDQHPEGALLVTAVFLYRSGIDNHSEFKKQLPHELAFDMTRTQVWKHLGKPSWSSPALPIDRWEYGDYQMILDFSKNEKQIDTVTLQLIGK